MATAFENLKVFNMTKDALDAALDCGRQVDGLKFRLQDDYEVCDDSKGLESASRMFIEAFAPWSKFGGKASKLQAFRFKTPALLPVDASMLLIPTTPITVSNQAVEVGSYMQLTKDVSIASELVCFVFRTS